MSKPDFSLEQEFQGNIIAGVDEVGRGPWAGPVVAAAAILKQENFPPPLLSLINDSKKLSPLKRQQVFELLTVKFADNCIWQVGVALVEEIDQLNILQATYLAMKRAITNLSIQPEVILLDGRAGLIIPQKVIPVIKGDQKSLSIAAASIIAKVFRDNLMGDLSLQYPHYKWEKNAGYGTAAHIEAIKIHGITPHHRRSFRPIAEHLGGLDTAISFG